MPIFDIKMPKLGESITEGTIVSWSIKVGDTVKEDDILFEVTTAKVNAEVPCPIDGTVQELLFSEGDTIEVGTVIARILPEGEEASAPDSTASSSTAAAAPAPEATAAANSPAAIQQPEAIASPEAKPASEVSTATAAPSTVENTAAAKPDRWYSPVVLKLAKSAGIDSSELDSIPGTGYEGRLSKADLVDYLDRKKAGQPQTTSHSKQTASASEPTASEKKLIPAPAPISFEKPLTSTVQRADAEVVNMDPVARIIAERMVQSKKTSAHVTTVVEADVTKLVRWRSKVKDAFLKQEGIGLNYLPAIVEATSRALKEFPKLNASVEGTTFVLKKQINMGIAVALDDGNLVVPVIHGADQLSISGLAHSIETLATKARTNKLKLDEIEGGTFTITNFGTFRNIIGTPIINQPEVAILGVGYVEKKPAVVETPEGDVIAIRHKMYLSLTYDHRIVNGAVGGAFLRRIADILENWNPA
jgi:2-oxoglutarate dehydrogenase E2 component (dihydrolipoamide succinyltransferase)